MLQRCDALKIVVANRPLQHRRKLRIIIPYFRESVVCHFDVIFCCIDGVTSRSLASGRLHESICYINDDVRHCSGFCSENRKEKNIYLSSRPQLF